MKITFESEYNKYIKASTSTGLTCNAEYLGNGKWKVSSYDPDTDETEVTLEFFYTYECLIFAALEFFGVN